MEKGLRSIRNEAKTKQPYSVNTEIWLSDFFWPFFSNYTFGEIITEVLKILIEDGGKSSLEVPVPDTLIDAFGEECKKYHLVDDEGKFDDAYKLVDLFCGKKSIK